MPPKRKPVQKEQKPIEEVATDTALVSLENVEEEVDNPVDDIPAQAVSKKAATKKPKKTNNQQKVSELKGEEKEQRPEEEVGKENVESVKNEEETFITKERPELTRRGARRGHPVEIAPSTHVSGDNVGADAIPERDIDQDNVKVLISGDETSKKEAPQRRGAKRAVHKNDAASSDQEGNGDFEENPQNQNESPKKKRGGKKNQESDQEVGPSKTLRGGLKNAQESEQEAEPSRTRRGAQKNYREGNDDSEEHPQKVGEGNNDPVKDIQHAQASKKAASKKPKKPDVKDHEGAGDSEELPQNQNDSPKRKRGGKKNVQETEPEAGPSKIQRGGQKDVQESEQVAEPSKTRRGAPKNVQDDEGIADSEERTQNQNDSPKKKRGGKKNVQESEQEEAAPSRTRRGGPKNVQDDEGAGDSEEHPQEQNDSPKKKRGGKKNVQESEQEAAAPSRTQRGGQKNVQAAKEVPKEDPELSDDEAGAGKKRGRKAKEDQASKKNGAEPEEKKSKQEEETIDYGCDKENKKGEKWNLKISTWNVAGLRAWVKKNGIDYVKEEDADIICFQETKCPENKVPAEAKVDGYHTYWVNGVKDGYAGVALYTKEKPLNVSYGINNKEHDEEGRVITAEYEKFYLVTTYVPNSGQGLKTLSKRMSWDEIFRNYLKELDAKKPVILCGDLNVAHEEIDLANPKTNTKSAGFTKEERENMTALLKEGFVDSFRQLYPGKTGCYTFWSYLGAARSRNTGWRLDYFVVSERLMDSVCDVAIRSKVLGSDHCPCTLFLHV